MFRKMLAAAALTTAAVHGATDLSSSATLHRSGTKAASTTEVSVKVTQSNGAAVDGARTLTWLHNGSPAWPDVSGATFFDVPVHMLSALVEVPERILEGGSQVDFVCPPYGVGIACDAYVLIFECSPCESQKGTLAENLLAEGWERTRCAPKFKTGVDGGALHLMSSYRKSVPAGQKLTVQTDANAPTEWTAFAIKGYSVECDLFDNAQTCNDDAGFCVWKGYECVTNTCITPGPVYRTGCTACPNDEVPAYFR